MWGIPAVKPLLNQGQRQRHLIWAKEKKTWTVAQWSTGFFSNESSISKNPKIKAQSLQEEWTDTEPKLLNVQCEVSTAGDDLEFSDICWC